MLPRVIVLIVDLIVRERNITMRRKWGMMMCGVLPALLVAIGGCASSGSGGKAGGPAAPHTLRLGTVEDQTANYAPEVKAFAKSVDDLSNGALKIDIAWGAPGAFTARSEQDLAEMVTRGDIDLGLVPTRIWSKANMTTLQPVETPFLIDSVALLNEVARSDVATEMLAGLDKIGDTGLAIWPDALRHPLGYFKPLVTLADFNGQKLRTPLSDVADQLVTALGAQTVDPSDGEVATPGSLDGAETAFVASYTLPKFGTFTGNVSFYPKANAVVANGKRFAALTKDEQKVLRRAATDTVNFAIGHNGSERELALAYCAAGGSVAMASDADIEQMVAATEPISTKLEQDAQNKKVIDAIKTMKADLDVDSDAAVACQPINHSPAVTTPGGGFPEGTYRTNSPLDGIVTMTYLKGVWQRIKADGTLDCAATFEVTDGRIYLTMSTDPTLDCGDPPGKLFLDSAWTLNGDQLRFVDINSDPGAVTEFGLPWTKIG
jgi:TRAP-type C4-dicarboxylate transport system substrate-binding protein